MPDLQSLRDTLIDALTQRVRVLSESQARHLIGEADADGVMEDLVRLGFVAVEDRLVSVPGDAVDPVWSWRPGDANPDCKRVAANLRGRDREIEEVKLFFPTAIACRMYGGTRIRPRTSELNHDLRMTAVYLRYREDLDRMGLSWCSGDAIRSDHEPHLFGGAIPDACLRSPDGEVVRIIEGGGEGYGKGKIASLHGAYSRVCGYEVW